MSRKNISKAKIKKMNRRTSALFKSDSEFEDLSDIDEPYFDSFSEMSDSESEDLSNNDDEYKKIFLDYIIKKLTNNGPLLIKSDSESDEDD